MEYKTGWVGMNYHVLPTHFIDPEIWEMMVKAVKKMEEE